MGYMNMKIADFWQGKSRFFCKGSLITGPDWYKGVLTGSFTMLISCLLYAYPFNFFVQRENYPPIVIFTALLPVTMYYLFAVATRDPGYIPRQSSVFATKANDALNEYITSLKPLILQHKGTIIKMKFCKTCMLFRPPRGSHCSICDLCVEEFDHHCPWIGNCVGKRNYFYFFKFLLSINLLTITGFAVCLGHVAKYNEDRGLNVIASFVLTVLLFLVLFFVGGLFGFHVYLLVTGSTTNEKIKQTWPSKDFNPYSFRSVLQNCGIKYKAAKSRPQFDPKTVLRAEEEEISPNEVLRKVKVKKVYRIFGTVEDTLAEKGKLQTVGNKAATSRPHSPLQSEN
jgi:palmitoyltransferase ZDHHC9/14/18